MTAKQQLRNARRLERLAHISYHKHRGEQPEPPDQLHPDYIKADHRAFMAALSVSKLRDRKG